MPAVTVSPKYQVVIPKAVRERAGITPGELPGPAELGLAGAHVLDRSTVADPRGVVVDQIALEVPHLVVVEHDLRELPDPGVDSVHDLARGQLLLEHAAAGDDPFPRGGIERHLVMIAGHGDGWPFPRGGAAGRASLQRRARPAQSRASTAPGEEIDRAPERS